MVEQWSVQMPKLGTKQHLDPPTQNATIGSNMTHVQNLSSHRRRKLNIDKHHCISRASTIVCKVD